jgi:hypothetical protein
MVSNASDDFPDPDRPVKTISLSRGSSSDRFLRLCSRAPRMRMVSDDMAPFDSASVDLTMVVQVLTERMFDANCRSGCCTVCRWTGMSPIVAYLDAGTGSLLLQALLGGLAGIGVAFRAFRMRPHPQSKRERPESNEHSVMSVAGVMLLLCDGRSSVQGTAERESRGLVHSDPGSVSLSAGWAVGVAVHARRYPLTGNHVADCQSSPSSGGALTWLPPRRRHRRLRLVGSDLMAASGLQPVE